MVTTRYSDQKGSKSRQNSFQVQPTENTENLSASRRCLWVRTTREESRVVSKHRIQTEYGDEQTDAGRDG